MVRETLGTREYSRGSRSLIATWLLVLNSIGMPCHSATVRAIVQRLIR